MIITNVYNTYLKTKIESVLKAYAEIFFLHGVWPGLLVLAITFINPQMAFAGILAIVVAFAFASLVGYKQVFLNSGFYTYNTLLIGFSIGATFKLTLVTLLLLVSVSIFSFVVSVFLANMFFTSFRLPILSIPFVIVTSLIYLAAGRYSNLYVSGLYAKQAFDGFAFLHPWMVSFFKAMGSIVFLPDVRVGLLLTALLLWRSRLLVILAVSGFLVGGFAHGFYVGAWSTAIADPSSFNYILIAMAIGGVFLIPSIQSFLIAMVGVLIATVLIDAVNVFWTQFAIPVFTLPFTVVTLLFVYMINLIDHPLCTRVFKETPEKTLDHYLTTKIRFCKEYAISLPFFGHWTVWQGFDGEWTHKGLWQYAYDFVQIGPTQKTYANEGLMLADYACYQQPVTSPVQGRIVWVVKHFPDNPIGTVDTVNNWGNMVMIYDARGFYAVLAHFAENSIVVNEGDWVYEGTFLGECGNSGYSPQPHIHMHLQWTMSMLSMTIPFRFTNYAVGDVQTHAAQEAPSKTYHTHAIPAVGETVTHSPLNPFWDQLTNFALDDTLTFDVFQNDRKRGSVTLEVTMAIDGTFYWATPNAKLYFGKWGGTFFCFHIEGDDPYLRLIYLALPKMPLVGESPLTWNDILPVSQALSGWRRAVAGVFAALRPTYGMAKGQYRLASHTEIAGEIVHPLKRTKTTIALDSARQILAVSCEGTTLRRVVPTQSKSYV